MSNRLNPDIRALAKQVRLYAERHKIASYRPSDRCRSNLEQAMGLSARSPGQMAALRRAHHHFIAMRAIVETR